MKHKFKSIVLWPETVCLGRTPNESFDTHVTREQAEHVCDQLRSRGLGLDGKIFPISTRVEPIASAP